MKAREDKRQTYGRNSIFRLDPRYGVNIRILNGKCSNNNGNQVIELGCDQRGWDSLAVSMRRWPSTLRWDEQRMSRVLWRHQEGDKRMKMGVDGGMTAKDKYGPKWGTWCSQALMVPARQSK